MPKSVDFDHYTENYNTLLTERTRFFSSSEEYFARYKVELVRSRIDKQIGSLLEYGCGIGRNIPFLQQSFPEARVVGSDISAASLEFAKQENQEVDFFIEDESTNCDDSFDLIFVAGVFHHIPIPQRTEVAKTLLTRLSPRGSLFVFEHNPYNPVTRHIVSQCPYDADAVLLKPSELVHLLRAADLLVLKKGYCLFIPPRLSVLAHVEDWLAWLPLGGQYWVQAKRPS